MVIKPEAGPGKKTYSACIAVFGEPQLLYARDEYQVYEQYDPHAFDHTDLSDVIMRFDKHISVEQVRETIANAPGCKLVDDLSKKMYPMPLDTSDQDIVFVGRIRPDLTDDNGICLWCCGDQVRKGAATNAIQIAELLVK